MVIIRLYSEDKLVDYEFNEFAKENDEVNFNTEGKDYLAVNDILSKYEEKKGIDDE